MKTASDDIRLRWVQLDPSTERAVDPLGMGAQADRIADLLLPQISVATRRARYLSFFCWAVRKSGGDQRRIHRLEAELALEEAKRHENEASDVCPGVVGRSRALKYLQKHNWQPPSRPERLYKNTAFAIYRPTLKGLGLLTGSRSPQLTEEGSRLASLYESSRGRKPRCLGDISSAEQGRIKKLLGLDFRTRYDLTRASELRRATYEAVWRDLERGGSLSSLERHAILSARPSPVAMLLHRSLVWELLSCGLTLGLLRLIKARDVNPAAKELRNQLGLRPRCPALGQFEAEADKSPGQVVALLRAATSSDPVMLDLEVEPFSIASLLVKERKPHEFLRTLVERHHWAKADAPWVALMQDKVQVLAIKKNIPESITPRSYRLDAFRQLLVDLRLIQ